MKQTGNNTAPNWVICPECRGRGTVFKTHFRDGRIPCPCCSGKKHALGTNKKIYIQKEIADSWPVTKKIIESHSK